MERLKEDQADLYLPALNSMAQHIRASTTSMTSVPKPLKFMRPHYETMKEIFARMQKSPVTTNDKAVLKLCAEIISVLAMTMGTGKECLVYRLYSDEKEEAEIGEWGHEYVRHLSGEIATNWTDDQSENFRARLTRLVEKIVPYNMQHNAEAEACDLLMEIERLDMLEQYVDESAYPRVCLYLQSCVPYVPDPENVNLLRCALNLFKKFNQYTQAMRLALQLNETETIKEVFINCPDGSTQKQLAYMLGRQQVFLELPEGFSSDIQEDLVDIMSNAHLNNHFLNLARELDIMEPKTPEDVYKSHLENSRTPFGSSQIDSARQNLAASFVNGFVNAGFGSDKLLMEDGNKWLYKNKEHGMFSAMASLGLILLWDVDGGLTPIDKYLYTSEDHIKGGALLACGIVNTGVRNEVDPALALLSDYVLHTNPIMRIGSILGLGLAYAGSNRKDVIELITPVFSTDKKAGSTNEVLGIAALSLGMIAVGSCNAEVTDILTQTIMERSESDFRDTFAKFLFLGLGLVYLGRQEAAEAVIAALSVIDEPHRSTATTMVEICAYAGTGNVLKIQHLLHLCSEHYEPYSPDNANDKTKTKEQIEQQQKEEREKDLSQCQAVAVLGIALIALGEDIGSDMAYRSFGNLLRYCEPTIRRAVPLALGLIAVSNPKLNILDTLSKFSHDSDAEVAHNSIFAMGLVGAGTNNARLAAMLRQLAQYHAKDPNNLFMVRIAQGLTHLGKGTLTLSPYHSDRQLMSPVALAGLMATLVAFLDVKNSEYNFVLMLRQFNDFISSLQSFYQNRTISSTHLQLQCSQEC